MLLETVFCCCRLQARSKVANICFLVLIDVKTWKSLHYLILININVFSGSKDSTQPVSLSLFLSPQILFIHMVSNQLGSQYHLYTQNTAKSSLLSTEHGENIRHCWVCSNSPNASLTPNSLSNHIFWYISLMAELKSVR